VLVLGLLLAVAIGAALGSVGSGGSILALPVLVYVLDVPPASAIPMAMVLVGAASLGAGYLQWRQGFLSWRALALMSSTGLVGAYWGSGLTRFVDSDTLMLMFAVLLLAVGLFMLSNPERRLQPHPCQVSRCMISGAVVGLLTGFLGVGGGFLLVPTLVLFAGLNLKRAVGTSAGIISINALAGILGQLRFTSIDWQLTGLLLAAAFLGVVLGVSTARQLPEQALRRGLALLMIAIGLSIGATTARSL
jgi:uncharacterized membrane protein YfcA